MYSLGNAVISIYSYATLMTNEVNMCVYRDNQLKLKPNESNLVLFTIFDRKINELEYTSTHTSGDQMTNTIKVTFRA